MPTVRREYKLRHRLEEAFSIFAPEKLQDLMPRVLRPRISGDRLTLRLLNQDMTYLVDHDVVGGRAVTIKAKSLECSPLRSFTLETKFRDSDGQVTVEEVATFSAGSKILDVALGPLLKRAFSKILHYREEAVKSRLGEGPQPTDRNPFSIPLHPGSALQAAALAAGFALLWMAFPSRIVALDLLILFASWVIFWYFSHCLSHYIVGRLLGVRFTTYFLGISNLYRISSLRKIGCYMFTLGIQVDREAGRRTRARMAAMYLSGVLASMFLPLTTVFRAFEAGAADLAFLMSLVTASNIAFTLYFSSRAGDIRKALNVLRRERTP